MKLIPLNHSLFTKVDDADYERVFNFGKWVAERRENNYYARCYKGKSRFYMHVFITGKKGMDHKDRDGLNNQRDNLREATVSQNGGNARKDITRATSSFKGVSQHRSRWTARISNIRLGTFSTEEEAARAYNEAAKVKYGEFALLNEGV